MAENIDVEAFKTFERTSYSNVAEGYANKSAHVSAQANRAILDAAHVGHGSTVLDVACGPGLLSAAAVARGALLTGVDFSPAMIAIARTQCPGGTFHEADAESLPFRHARFDAVLCSLGILHFPRPEAAVAEAFRVLKPGGRYAFTCWTPPAGNPLMGIIVGAVQAHGTLDVGLPPGPPLFRFGQQAECESVLRGVGFQDIAVTECALVWPASSAEDFLQEIPRAAGRLGPLLALQSDDDRRAIGQAIIDRARAYQTEAGVRIPASVLLACGTTPNAAPS